MYYAFENTTLSSLSGVRLAYGVPSSLSGAESSSAHVDSDRQASMEDANMTNNIVVMVPSSGSVEKRFVATLNEAFERLINDFSEGSELVYFYLFNICAGTQFGADTMTWKPFCKRPWYFSGSLVKKIRSNGSITDN